MSLTRPNTRGLQPSRPWLRLCLLGALGFGLGAGGACFTDTPIPPTFRFQCTDDDQCDAITDDDGEVLYAQQCIDGLCQYTCTTDLLADQNDCPPNEGFFGCFNGICTHLCDGEERLCSAPHECVVADLPPEAEGLLKQLGLEELAVCGIRCDDADASSCPDGQACFDGFCVDLSGFTTGSDTDTDTGTDTDTDTTGGSL